jgi:hypothetical protein
MPEFTKYLPLEKWFRERPAKLKRLKLTFAQVEKILGEPLPLSATKSKNWWANFHPKIQSHRTAWLNNGWMVVASDQRAKWAKFARTPVEKEKK